MRSISTSSSEKNSKKYANKPKKVFLTSKEQEQINLKEEIRCKLTMLELDRMKNNTKR